MNKIMAVHPSLNDHMMNASNNDNNLSGIRAGSGPHESISMNNYQSLLRQNSVNSNPNSLQPDMSCNYGSGLSQLHQSAAVSFQNPAAALKNNAPINYLLSSSHQRPPPQVPGNLPPSQSNQQQQQQQQVIQQLLQEMMSSNRAAAPEEAFGGSATAFQGRGATGPMQNMSFSNGGTATNPIGGMMMSRNSSFKSISSNPAPLGNGGGFGMRSTEVNLPDLVNEISREFGENGLLTGEAGADIGYGGKWLRKVNDLRDLYIKEYKVCQCRCTVTKARDYDVNTPQRDLS